MRRSLYQPSRRDQLMHRCPLHCAAKPHATMSAVEHAALSEPKTASSLDGTLELAYDPASPASDCPLNLTTNGHVFYARASAKALGDNLSRARSDDPFLEGLQAVRSRPPVLTCMDLMNSHNITRTQMMIIIIYYCAEPDKREGANRTQR